MFSIHDILDTEGNLTESAKHLAECLKGAYGAAGFVDDHLHADRVGTGLERYFETEGGFAAWANASLVQKQDAVGILHRGPAFDEKELTSRMNAIVQFKIAAGEVGARFIVDCSPDIEGRAFRAAQDLRKKYEGVFQIDVAVYPIFGLKDWNSDRWEHLKKLAPEAQFIMGLPERDARGDHPIGFEGHLAHLYELAKEHKKPLHVHVDQTNTPGEDGTWRLINSIRTLSAGVPPDKRPKVAAVHVLIDGKEDEERVDILHDLKTLDIDMVCCPHAAGSMRQRRDHQGPTHSSMAPVREALLLGINVSLGTDNTDDHLMPLPRMPLLLREIEMFSSLARYYDAGVIWKLARKQPLNSTDRASVARSLTEDYKAFGLPNPWLRWMN